MAAGFAAAACVPAHGQYTAEHFVATGSGQDTPFFFRAAGGGNYQDNELFVFEGLIENNSATGASEITLWESPKSAPTIRASSNLPWSTAPSAGFIIWDFELIYMPGTSITYSLSAPSQTTQTGTWNFSDNALGGPGKPDTLLTDIIIRAAPRNQDPATADTQVSLTNLQLKVGANPYEDILNPTTSANNLVATANNPLAYRPVQFLFLDNVLNPAQEFGVRGQVALSWESPLQGGVSPINGANLAWEFKVGNFEVVPEGELLWAMVPMACAAGWYVRRRLRA